MDIKALILDVDGVIIGEKLGFNAPYPNAKVIETLKLIRSRGIPITLCTAKPYFAIEKIISHAQLNNYHIVDGGGVIIDPIDNKVLKTNTLDGKAASKVIRAYLKENAYTEIYTVDNYIIQKDQKSQITSKHKLVLQREPTIVDSLPEAAAEFGVTKIMPVARNEKDKERLTKVFEPFKEELMLNWGVHPIILPLQFGIITAKGISKGSAAKEIISNQGISFDNVLGIGDSTSDWKFISLCKYGAAMGNAKEELKQKVLSKGKGYGFVGPSVDENGILNIFEHYKII